MKKRRLAARLTLALGMAAVVVGAPAFAWALCPNCLGQSRDLGATLKLIGGFLLVPFLIVYVAQRVIRRACRVPPDQEDRPPLVDRPEGAGHHTPGLPLCGAEIPPAPTSPSRTSNAKWHWSDR